MRHFIYFRRIADIAADEDDLDLRMGLHELSAQFDPAGAIQLNVDQKDIGLCQKLLIRQTFLRASIMLQVKLMTREFFADDFLIIRGLDVSVLRDPDIQTIHDSFPSFECVDPCFSD